MIFGNPVLIKKITFIFVIKFRKVVGTYTILDYNAYSTVVIKSVQSLIWFIAIRIQTGAAGSLTTKSFLVVKSSTLLITTVHNYIHTEYVNMSNMCNMYLIWFQIKMILRFR